jgi:hypothetical protein
VHIYNNNAGVFKCETQKQGFAENLLVCETAGSARGEDGSHTVLLKRFNEFQVLEGKRRPRLVNQFRLLDATQIDLMLLDKSRECWDAISCKVVAIPGQHVQRSIPYLSEV